MRNFKAPESQTMRRILFIACATALTVAFMVSPAQPARAAAVTPPPVPANIQVPAGNKLFLVGHAVGTQNYVCLPSGAGVAFTLFTPQATLFDDGKQVITHYFSPNPDLKGWHDSRHVAALARHEHRLGPGAARPTPPPTPPSSNRARLPGSCSTVVGSQNGPTGGDKLTATTFIQRLNTSGGLAPSTGCSSLDRRR